MTLSGTNISMTRGDTETLKVKCPKEPFVDGDAVYMTVRESVDSPVAFQKVVTEFDAGEAVIVIDHEDTEGLDFGSYLYDIQVTRKSGAVKTLVKPSKLTLTEEITYD